MEKRAFLLVIDGFGVGEAPDAKFYGDVGSNTFVNLLNQVSLNIPNFRKLGLNKIDGLNLNDDNKSIGVYGKLQEKSVGKDTTTGHFEMMKIITKVPNPTYPNGFPKEVIDKLESVWNTKILGNYPASGIAIIKELGQKHLETEYPIVYTSADSVLQIATHIDVYPLEKLYELCEKAREIMTGKNAVGRIIARPFMTNSNGEFERINTARKDFSINPNKPNTMSELISHGLDVIAVGKIEDIFNHQSITKSFSNHTNSESIEVVKKLVKEKFNGLCFVNLVDTDMIFGHRNDVIGYAKALEDIDKVIPYIIDNMNENDYLIFSADHGCDPTTPSTDHSREYVPFLCYSKSLKKSVNLGTLLGFDNIGIFIEKLFNISSEESIIYDEINN